MPALRQRVLNASKVRHSAIDTAFRGNGKAALSTTPTTQGLGASTRIGWRLNCTPQERAIHGARATRSDAHFTAYNGVPSATGIAAPLIEGRNNGRTEYKATPNSGAPVLHRASVKNEELLETVNASRSKSAAWQI